MRRGLSILCSVAVGFIASNCGDELGPRPDPDPMPDPGSLFVRLANAAPDDRGLLFDVQDVSLDSIVPARADYRVFSREISARHWRVIVVGDLTDGVIVRFVVPDRDSVARYLPLLTDVATDSYAQASPGSRTLAVTR